MVSLPHRSLAVHDLTTTMLFWQPDDEETIVSSKKITQAHRHSSVAYTRTGGSGISSQFTVASAGTPKMTGPIVSTNARKAKAMLLFPHASVAVQVNRYKLIYPSTLQLPSSSRCSSKA